MKKMHTRFFGFILIGATIVLVYIYYMSKHKTAIGDIQLMFVKSFGLLADNGIAIDKYEEAISLAKKVGVGPLRISKVIENDTRPTLSSIHRVQIEKLILQGAKSRKLGIKVEIPEIASFKIYTFDGKNLDVNDVRLLSELITYLAKSELNAGNIDKAIRIASANLAFGIQLMEYNVDVLCMYGIGCKAAGLKMLEECAHFKNDQHLLNQVLSMSKEVEKEFKLVKKMPVPKPSILQEFIRCINN